MLDEAAIKFAATAAALVAPDDESLQRGRTPLNQSGSRAPESSPLQRRSDRRDTRLARFNDRAFREDRSQRPESRTAHQFGDHRDSAGVALHRATEGASPRRAVSWTVLETDAALKRGAFILAFYFFAWFGWALYWLLFA